MSGSASSDGSVKPKDAGADAVLDGARGHGGKGPTRTDSGAHDASADALTNDARVPSDASDGEAGTAPTADAYADGATHGPMAGGGGLFAPCTSNGLQISPNPMYSAYIENSNIRFRVPAAVNAGSIAPIVWAASDPSMVGFEITGPGTVMITSVKAGRVTIEAQWNGACGTADLNISEATKASWLAGKQRYNNGNPLPTLPTNPSTGLPVLPTDGSQPVIDPPTRPPACTSCHGDNPTSSYFRAPVPDPRQTAVFSDWEIAAIVTHGDVPGIPYYDPSLMPPQYWPFFHRWQDMYSSDDITAMVVYLRSLPPSTQ